MPIRSIARLIQTMLYARRFFPYYVYNILGGIEEDGRSYDLSTDAPTTRHVYRELVFTCFIIGTGAVYSFDPVGSYEREACRAAGAAQALVQPFLDNQVSFAAITHFYPSARESSVSHLLHTDRRDPTLHRRAAGRSVSPHPPFVLHDSQANADVHRSTSRIRRQRLAQSSHNIFLFRQCSKSLSTHLLALLSGISR